MDNLKRNLRRFWKFVWEDDSLLSWIVNVIIAFILVKFLIYPGLGLILGTSYPVVAVVSGSMEHNSNNWWEKNKDWYLENNITEEQLNSFSNGFNKGDIMILKNGAPEKLKEGDVIVYSTSSASNPIIHRIVQIWQENDQYYFQTKGDNNKEQLSFEKKISEDQIEGKAIIKIPFLGWVKIIFTNIITGGQ